MLIVVDTDKGLLSMELLQTMSGMGTNLPDIFNSKDKRCFRSKCR